MNNHFHKIAWLFVITYIAAMFLPRLAVEGMFADGLCYASIARNMAEGRGWFWEPFFSTSFWLPYNTGSIFYENLPLMFWLESWFFRVFGDHWWTERIYCALILVGTALWIVAIWRKTMGNYREYAWLPLFLWYGFPTVIWASPNNQLDYTEGFFSLAAVYFMLPKTKTWKLVLGGILTFLALLAKGPVGLFPLAVPIITLLIDKKTLANALLETIVVCLTFVVLLFILWQYVPAQSWLSHYLDQQFFNAIAGKRETSGEGWTARLYILQQIVVQNTPSVVFALICGFLMTRKQKYSTIGFSQKGLFFLFVALAASLPIMISPKQHEIYLLPAFPFYAMAIAAFFVPVVHGWAINVDMAKTFNYWKNGLFVVLVGALGYSFWLWGKPGREEDVLADMKRLSSLIPNQSKVGVCSNMMPDFVHHCYFQRYHQWELTTDLSQTNYLLIQSDCDTTFIHQIEKQGFAFTPMPNEKYRLYKKN